MTLQLTVNKFDFAALLSDFKCFFVSLLLHDLVGELTSTFNAILDNQRNVSAISWLGQHFSHRLSTKSCETNENVEFERGFSTKMIINMSVITKISLRSAVRDENVDWIVENWPTGSLISSSILWTKVLTMSCSQCFDGGVF